MVSTEVSTDTAEVLFHSGTVWRGPDTADAHALLVRGGRVTAFDAAAERLATADTRRVDLDGGFLMPSFGDGHAHPIFGGLEEDGPAVGACTSISQIAAEVGRYARDHPEKEWIFGASYDGSLSAGGLFDARWLDDTVPDRPVVLRAWDYHTVWVNTRALQLAGIDATTPDPPLGHIPHRPDGTPLGTLREWGAVDLAMNASPGRTEDERQRAIQAAGRYYLARGVTWVQDAWVEPRDVETYLAAAAADTLPLRFNLAFFADPRVFDRQLPWMRESRDRVRSARHPLLTAHTVKFFADGVVENETGALLQPYCSGLHDHGMQVWGPGPELADAVCTVDAAGFQVHIHAIGDAAVRQALDAIEHAVAVNGPRDRRPVIAHAQLVDDADLARFAQLGVIACMQPLWAQLDPLMTVLTVPRLGPERSDRQYRMRSLRDSAATLSFGSDWPCSSGDPREGIAIATTRRTADGDPAGGWVPDEIVPMEQSLHAYSTATAHQAFADSAEAPWGVLRAGASADLVHLAHDPRAQPAQALPGNQVRATYIAGAARYHMA